MEFPSKKKINYHKTINNYGSSSVEKNRFTKREIRADPVILDEEITEIDIAEEVGGIGGILKVLASFRASNYDLLVVYFEDVVFGVGSVVVRDDGGLSEELFESQLGGATLHSE